MLSRRNRSDSDFDVDSSARITLVFQCVNKYLKKKERKGHFPRSSILIRNSSIPLEF